VRSRVPNIAVIAAAVSLSLAPRSSAQTVEWGAKAEITTSSVREVAGYYDWLLCCHPLFPGAMVDAKSGTAGTAGVFVAAPVEGWFAVQSELQFSRRQHSVGLQPYEAMTVSFTRDYIEAGGSGTSDDPRRWSESLLRRGGARLWIHGR
jgi:hypothetical protein